MIEAIHVMFEVWGGQELVKQHDENQGHPGRSSIARARESQFDPTKPTPLLRQKKRTAFGRDTFLPHPVQFTEEGHTGDGLTVARALIGAPEALQTIAFTHYAVIGFNAKDKAARLGITAPEYWRFIDRLHYWVAARISSPDVSLLDSASTCQLKGNLLRVVVKTAKTPRQVIRSPELSFAALRRETISLKR